MRHDEDKKEDQELDVKVVNFPLLNRHFFVHQYIQSKLFELILVEAKCYMSIICLQRIFTSTTKQGQIEDSL